LYRVFRSAQVPTAAGRSSISVYRNSIPDNAEVTAVQKSVPKAFYRSAASITASRSVPLPSWTRVASFDHLVGAEYQRAGDIVADGVCGLKIDD